MPAWHIWSDLREMMNSFYTDDLPQRLVVLWVMALLVLFSSNATSAPESLTAMRTAAGAYVVARFTGVCVLVVTSFASYQHRAQSRILAALMLVGLVLVVPVFLASVSVPAKAAVVAVILAYQEAAWAVSLSPWIKRRLRLTYSTAVDISHEVDRLAAFFIIILGEFVYWAIVDSPAGIGLTYGYLKAVCTLVVAFCLNWVYASGDGAGALSTHPIRRSAWSAFAFFLLHLPLAASFTIGGHIAAISTGMDQFETGHRWLLCGGLAVGMACLWVYGMIYRTSPHETLLLPKRLRVGMRLVLAVILAVLPETHDYLSATELMVIIMCLFIFLLIYETVGGLSKQVRFFEPWTDRHPPPSPQSMEQSSDA